MTANYRIEWIETTDFIEWVQLRSELQKERHMPDDWEIMIAGLDRPAAEDTLQALARLRDRMQRAEQALYDISRGNLGSQYITVQEFASRALVHLDHQEEGERLWR